MALSNTATPIYYGRFREAVMRGEIPVCREISMEMNRIDDLIANPGIYYDDKAINGFIAFCEDELTLTDGGDVKMLDSFKLWAEQIFGWYYFVERSVYVPNPHGAGQAHKEAAGDEAVSYHHTFGRKDHVPGIFAGVLYDRQHEHHPAADHSAYYEAGR